MLLFLWPPVQGHQILTGPQCSILFDEAVHASGREPECTVCQLPWSNHPRGKHIPKDLSSTISKCRASWERMSRNNTKTGMSMPGCPISPWKTRLSRLNCHSSRSWCASCSLSQARHQLSQGKNRQLAHLRSHPSQ